VRFCATADSGELQSWRAVCRYYDGDTLVGFGVCVIEECDVDGNSYSLIRGLHGLRREYRGKRETLRFWLRVVVPYFFRNLRRKILVFTPIAGLSAFAMIVRLAPEMYPRPGVTPPGDIMVLVTRLAAHAKYPIDPQNPWILHRPVHVRPYKQRAADDEISAFWDRMNPRAHEGDTILTLVPLTVKNVLGGLARVLSMALAHAGHRR
jgi:hypothetical protein